MKFRGRIGVTILILVLIMNLFAFLGISGEEKSTVIFLIFIFLPMDIFFFI
jgi:hypothetical protein